MLSVGGKTATSARAPLNVVVEHDLVISPSERYVERLLFVTMTLRNAGSQPVSLMRAGVGGRGPSCTVGDWSCGDITDFGMVQNVTLAAGESRTFSFWQMFHAVGSHFFQVTIQDAGGGWQQLGSLHQINLTSQPHAARQSTWQLGVQFHPLWQLENDRQRLMLAKSADVDIIRLAVAWRLLEPNSKGSYDAWYRDMVDQTIDTAKSLDLDVYIMLSATPCWASSDPAKNCGARYRDNRRFDADTLSWDAFYPPTNSSDYADALLKVIELYGDRVDAFEIWNEPNIERFWSPAPNSAEYHQLLQTAYAAAKAAYPAKTFLAGATAGADIVFIEELYEHGWASDFDVLAVHPYTAGAPLACPRYQAAASFRCGVDAIRDMMYHYGDSKPIWLTEFGWSTTFVSEFEQMTYLSQALGAVEQWEDVPVATVYNLVNTSGSSIAGEDNFGLFYGDLRPKLAAQWLQNQYAPLKVFVPIVTR